MPGKKSDREKLDEALRLIHEVIENTPGRMGRTI